MQNFYIVRIESRTKQWTVVFQTGNVLEATQYITFLHELNPELEYKILVELEA